MINKPPKFSGSLFGANRKELQSFVEQVFKDKVMLQKEHEELTQRIKDMETASLKSNEELNLSYAQLQSHAEQIQSELNDASEQLNSAHLHSEILESEKKAVEAKLEEAKLKLQEYESAAQVDVNSGMDRSEEILDLRKNLSEAQSQLLEERQKLESVKLENSYRDSELSAARREIELLEARLDPTGTSRDLIRTEMERLQELEVALAEKQRIIDELTSQSREQGAHDDSGEFDGTLGSSDKLLAEFNQLKGEYQTLKEGDLAVIQSLEAERDQLRSELQENQSRFAAQLSAMREDFNLLQSERNQANQNFNENNSGGQADQAEYERLLADSRTNEENLRRELRSTKGDLESAQNSLRQLTERSQWNGGLESELNKSRSNEQSLRAEVAQLRAALNEDASIRESLHETQIALEKVRLGTEKERQLILNAANQHAEEIVGRAQRRASEETWEIHKAQLEKLRFIESFRDLLNGYLGEMDHLEQSASNSSADANWNSQSEKGSLDSKNQDLVQSHVSNLQAAESEPIPFSERLNAAPISTSIDSENSCSENVNWERRLKFVDIEPQNVGDLGTG